MSAFALVIAATQAFSVTVPAQSAIVNDGERVELPTCTTVVNNGLLILLMPDGARFVDDATVRPTVVVDPVPATSGAAQVRQAYEADRTRGRMVDIKVTYSTRKGVRTHASLSLPMSTTSNMLSGEWRTGPRTGETYLDGETLAIITDGDAPVVRYTRGDVVRNSRGRLVPGRWSVETPIAADGTARVASSSMYMDGYYRRVRLEVSIPAP